MIPDLPALALHPASMDGFAVYQLLTYSLVHGNWSHLIGNAISIAVFFVVSSLASVRYAATAFLLGILAGGVIGYVFAPAICIGASAGVLCLMSSMRGPARGLCVFLAMCNLINLNILHLAGFFAGLLLYVSFLPRRGG